MISSMRNFGLIVNFEVIRGDMTVAAKVLHKAEGKQNYFIIL